MYTFKKNERLTSLKEIDSLFERGRNSSVSVFPVRAVYQTLPMPQDGRPTPPVKVLISVAKKRLHHAVDRNRAKRQLREAYRLQHHPLSHTLSHGTSPLVMRLALIWLSETPQPSSRVSEAVGRILSLIDKRLTEGQTKSPSAQ